MRISDWSSDVCSSDLSAWSRWPNSQGIALARIEAMQKTGRDQDAVAFLAQRIGQWPELPRLYQLQAQSQERLGQKVAARRSMATYYDLTGALPTAFEQLQQARSKLGRALCRERVCQYV